MNDSAPNSWLKQLTIMNNVVKKRVIGVLFYYACMCFEKKRNGPTSLHWPDHFL